MKNRKRGAPIFDRKKPNRVVKKSFLIICEGKNTEPSYFNHFKLSTATIKPIGKGVSNLFLVGQAIKIKKQYEEDNKEFDFVWCVFDADPNHDSPKQLINFTDALSLAESNSIKVAYSNQAFEYWFILHFEDHRGENMPRGDYHYKINGYLKPLKCFYDGKKTKKINDDFFNQLLVEENGISRQYKAIERAKRNLKWHEEHNTAPANAESSTTVFKLVEELNKYR